MANKIQISTVRKEADVQVIELNAQFIARVVESETLTRFIMTSLDHMESTCDDELPYAKVECPTLTYWRMDLEKVWNLLQDVKKAFLDEEPTKNGQS